jgi:hypothetical protein
MEVNEQVTISVSVKSKAWASGHLLPGIAVSNSFGGVDGCP